MALSNYDAQSTNNSKRSARIYSDLNLNFTKNPATKDVARLTDVEAVKRSVRNLILTNRFERPNCAGRILMLVRRVRLCWRATGAPRQA